MELEKLCTKCKQMKPLSGFRKQSKTKDGLKYTCKECDDAKQHELYEKNRDKRITQVLNNRNKNK